MVDPWWIHNIFHQMSLSYILYSIFSLDILVQLLLITERFLHLTGPAFQSCLDSKGLAVPFPCVEQIYHQRLAMGQIPTQR